DELWREQIAHPGEDRRIGAILAAALPALSADTALPARAFGVELDARVELDREPRAIGRMLRQACSVLAIEPPMVWFDPAAAALSWRPGDGAVAAWRAATELTANRAGFVLAGDLDTAACAIATEGAALGLGVKQRLRDLFGYAASERYFAVRRHLGQQIAAP